MNNREIILTLGGKDAAVSKPNGVFAKQKLLLLLLAWTLIAIGCDNGEEEKPDVAKNQTATRTLAHEVGTVTITGFMTNAQWNGVADKIAARVNNKINTDITSEPDVDWKSGYEELFGRGVIYIVEPNPVGYTSYKTTGDGKTIYIALDKVDTTVPASMLIELYQRKTVVDDVIIP